MMVVDLPWYRTNKSIDSKRIKIIYNEDGGADKDGVIELRRGVDELSLGDKRYAQVRIGVDDKYYMKGMAIYKDDMPDGIDILYNTNKKRGAPPEKVFKTQEPDMNSPEVDNIRKKLISEGFKDKALNDELIKRANAGVKEGTVPPDPDNPFGSTIRQKHYIDSEGNRQLSALNIGGQKKVRGRKEHGMNGLELSLLKYYQNNHSPC